MFFLVPIGTDAPVYHFPWATIGLIAANVLVTIAAAVHPEAAGGWILQYGDGLHPLQWISSNLIHGQSGSAVDALLHLAGNMVFLWGFGLVVEGKIGWLPFLAVYLGIGTVESAVRKLKSLIETARPTAASAEYQRLKSLLPNWQLDAEDLRQLAGLAYRGKFWKDAIPLLEEQIARSPDDSIKPRIKLAGLAVEIQKRPVYAQKVLAPIDAKALPPELAAACEKFLREAQRLIDDGVLELEGRSWS